MAAKKLTDVDISSSYDSVIVNDNGAIRQVSKNDIIAPYNNLKSELDTEISAERERINNLISKTDDADSKIDELKGDIDEITENIKPDISMFEWKDNDNLGKVENGISTLYTKAYGDRICLILNTINATVMYIRFYDGVGNILKTSSIANTNLWIVSVPDNAKTFGITFLTSEKSYVDRLLYLYDDNDLILKDIFTIGYYDNNYNEHYNDPNYLFVKDFPINNMGKNIVYALHSDATNTHMIAFVNDYGDVISVIDSTFDYSQLNIGYVSVPDDATKIRLCFAGQKHKDNFFYFVDQKNFTWFDYNNNTEKFVTKKEFKDNISNKSIYFYYYLFDNGLFFGDSLTSGDYGPLGTVNNHEASYPYFVGKISGMNINNQGKSGYSTKQIWDVVRATDLTQYGNGNGLAIFLECGGNGGFTDTLESDTTITNEQTYLDYADTNTGSYCKIIEYIKGQLPNAFIYLVSMPYMEKSGFDPVETNNRILEIAYKYDLPYLDIYNNGSTNAYNIDIMCPVDKVHRGRLGYLTMAKDVLNELNNAIMTNPSKYTPMN